MPSHFQGRPLPGLRSQEAQGRAQRQTKGSQGRSSSAGHTGQRPSEEPRQACSRDLEWEHLSRRNLKQKTLHSRPQGKEPYQTLGARHPATEPGAGTPGLRRSPPRTRGSLTGPWGSSTRSRQDKPCQILGQTHPILRARAEAPVPRQNRTPYRARPCSRTGQEAPVWEPGGNVRQRLGGRSPVQAQGGLQFQGREGQGEAALQAAAPRQPTARPASPIAALPAPGQVAAPSAPDLAQRSRPRVAAGHDE